MFKNSKKPYVAYAVNKKGEKTKIEAEYISIFLEDDKEICIRLNPHENFNGSLPIYTDSGEGCLLPENKKYSSQLIIKSCSSNVVHIDVEKYKSKEIKP